ncbi:glycosyltransferase family 2 protein [Paraburkholderia acidisoli]|uniref:Glycosyltransferase family 2 protein n=1 Tax=Paraburkholderia acidisoli TaxID=2571748 RepID=A0A7Z2GFZ6_9BURK|nr:glycosyltransferase family 2 protein [Paraburkholderia acidisoli]QGZ60794.1 glycosyltransferase family 2 protein [Paraburkholderia acidisoli]
MPLASQGHVDTGIVVVFYRPDEACVARANRLAAFGHCVVIDNTERERAAAHNVQPALDAAITYVANGENRGIATALNQGVEILLRADCRVALLFDQDSEPGEVLLRDLPATMRREIDAGRHFALIGPAYEDGRLGGTAAFVRFGFPALQRIAPEGSQLIDVDFLITSGSCVNLGAWATIGPMDDALFIDFVDLEWCVRARAAGFRVAGVPWLRLTHELGGEPVKFLGRTYPGHSPLRHYYLFRNAVALMKRSYVPWQWKANELLKMPFRLAIYGIWLKPRRRHLQMAFLGIWHGLMGRGGPLTAVH